MSLKSGEKYVWKPLPKMAMQQHETLRKGFKKKKR